MNPFSDEINQEHLFNIASGKAASPDTTSFLLDIIRIGTETREKFIEECVEDTSRFERPITRQKLKTLRSKDNKVISATTTRDLFGSMLYNSLEKRIDMAEVFTYPLTPIPLSLGHVDGTMQKTPKV